MHLDELAHEGQADAQAPFRAALMGSHLREQLKDMRQIGRGDADSCIGDADNRLTAFAGNTQLDPPARIRVLGRVRQQVRKHLCQPVEVAVDAKLFAVRLDDEGVPMLVDGRPGRFGTSDEHLAQFHALAPQLDLACTDAADVQQVVDEMNKMIQLAIHHFDRAPERRIKPGVEPGDLQARAKRGERVSQLVGQRRKELVLAAITVAQRLLGPSACGDVARGAEPLGDLAAVIQQWHGTRKRPAHRAVQTLDAML